MLRRLPRSLPRLASRPTRASTASIPFRAMTSRHMSSLPAVQPPISTVVPADSFQLLSTEQKAGDAEDILFKEQVEDVKKWWSSPRYKGIKRPYTPEDVVSKR